MLLTSEQARIIAESQSDLGGKTQKEMAKVLSDEGDQTEIFDPLTQLIVDTIGESDDLEIAENVIEYHIYQLNRAKEAISKLY